MKSDHVLDRFISVAERFERLEALFIWNRHREFLREKREVRKREWEALPFAERLPKLRRGPRKNHGGKRFRITIQNTERRNRMICDELIQRKKATGRPIVDKVNTKRSLCYELAQELNLSCGRVENIWQNRGLSSSTY